MSLTKAIAKETNKTTTTNGMKAKKSTLNACLDLFASIGASRGRDMVPAFYQAFAEDQDAAIRIALWARDAREGAGEREIFRGILKQLAQTDYKLVIRLLPKVVELGRWDDVLSLYGTAAQKEAFDFIRQALEAGDGLCAKWMPRKGDISVALRNHFGWTPKFYRKTLVGLTNVVETQMCNKQWTEIDYGKVPSLASSLYQKAFGRNDPEGYAKYIASLEKGEAKINAGAVYPYDITKSVRWGNSRVADQQWKSLPNYVPEGVNVLPVVDVSGSMFCSVVGNKNLSCMDVAVSLGLYLSERLTGDFKDHFITFSENPRLQKLSGSLSTRLDQLHRADWGMSTNLEAVFDLVLNAAVKNKVEQKDMPSVIVIFSDMQFNRCVSNKTAPGMVKEKYKKAGYEVPQVIFWNLNDYGNRPCEADKSGVSLVSGFSPSLMRTILSGVEVTPLDTMYEVIMKERYNY